MKVGRKLRGRASAASSALSLPAPIIMSRKTTIIEDEFDDDTDLPLPSAPLPNTGSRGPILAHISDDLQQSGSASRPNFAGIPDLGGPRNTVTDATPYKTFVLSRTRYSTRV